MCVKQIQSKWDVFPSGDILCGDFHQRIWKHRPGVWWCDFSNFSNAQGFNNMSISEIAHGIVNGNYRKVIVLLLNPGASDSLRRLIRMWVDSSCTCECWMIALVARPLVSMGADIYLAVLIFPTSPGCLQGRDSLFAFLTGRRIRINEHS